MENKDWREQFKQEFGIHFSDSEFSFAIASIESLLKSKQEEIEGEMEKFRTKLEWSGIQTPPESDQRNEYIKLNKYLDDLKNIITNILK